MLNDYVDFINKLYNILYFWKKKYETWFRCLDAFLTTHFIFTYDFYMIAVMFWTYCPRMQWSSYVHHMLIALIRSTYVCSYDNYIQKYIAKMLMSRWDIDWLVKL